LSLYKLQTNTHTQKKVEAIKKRKKKRELFDELIEKREQQFVYVNWEIKQLNRIMPLNVTMMTLSHQLFNSIQYFLVGSH
jgi:5,10-methylene-tetrahydrofolate dehydrogenase/methenyl tetrahydrofolate cyclohydrolase